MENTSGQGKSAVIPDEIRKWNWGALFLNLIWGLGNRTYIALLCLIPIVGVVMAFVLGAKGNKWAWQNKRWKSIEHFKRAQKIWSWVGLAVFLFLLFGIIPNIVIPNFMNFHEKLPTLEAKMELAKIRTLEEVYLANNIKYGSLVDIGWAIPSGLTRYTYSLSYSSTTFLARATGNIDRDATIDEWAVDQNHRMIHRTDDIKH